MKRAWMYLLSGVLVAACATVQPLDDRQIGLQKGSVFDTATPAPFNFESAGPPIATLPGSGMPPMITHTVDEDEMTITANANGCLQCHGKANANSRRKVKAVPASHYAKGADGKALSPPAINGRNYVCTSCHAPQADVKPLIENRSL